MTDSGLRVGEWMGWKLFGAAARIRIKLAYVTIKSEILSECD
jgi:hypothetical protein